MAPAVEKGITRARQAAAKEKTRQILQYIRAGSIPVAIIVIVFSYIKWFGPSSDATIANRNTNGGVQPTQSITATTKEKNGSVGISGSIPRFVAVKREIANIRVSPSSDSKTLAKPVKGTKMTVVRAKKQLVKGWNPWGGRLDSQ